MVRTVQPTQSGQIPLPELMAFEAAARLGSFHRAADELSITQSAVSHRVINLERRLGVALFLRKGRGIALTEDGARYLQGITTALQAIGSAGDALRAQEHTLLRLAVAPSVGTVWLLPALPQFSRMHPELQFHISTIAVPEDANRLSWDVLVHYGSGAATAQRRTMLLRDRLMLVGAREAVRQLGGVVQVAHVASVPVFRHAMLDWAGWTRGAFGKRIEAARPVHVDDAITMLEAAAAGAGLALTTRLAAKPYLDDGRLVQAHPFLLEDAAYYAELSESGLLKPGAKTLLHWLERLPPPAFD